MLQADRTPVGIQGKDRNFARGQQTVIFYGCLVGRRQDQGRLRETGEIATDPFVHRKHQDAVIGAGAEIASVA